MKFFLPFLFTFFYISAAGQTGVYFNEENLRSDTIDVINYDIHLEVTDFGGKTLNGHTNIGIQAKMATSVLNLDLLGFTVTEVKMNGVNLNFNYNDTLLHINLGATLITGDTATISVHYNGTTKLDPSGWGGFYYGNDYAFNLGVGFQDKPHNIGRYWFPCFDNFKERSTYSLHITTPNTHMASSIGEFIGQTTQGNNIVWHWQLNETIPTYLAMVAVNRYTEVSDTYNGVNANIPVALYAKAADTNALKASFANLYQAMDVFEEYFGPYQFNKIGYSVVPFNSGAMEHASNISYPSGSVDGQLTSETLMAHELGHQWWGNYATTLTPEDMWLNEGMASFTANLFLEHVYGWSTAQEEWKTTLFNILKKAHINEGGHLAISGVPHHLTYGDHVYKKGALVAQNLRVLMGNNNFKSVMTGFLNDRAFSSMTSLQLRDYIANQLFIDAHGFFDGWVFNGGFPGYEIDSLEITPTSGPYEIYLNVAQKLNNAPAQFTAIPLEVGFYNSEFELTVKEIMVAAGNTEVTLQLPFSPQMVTLNPNNKLNYAATDDIHVIKQPGTYNSPNAMFNMKVNTVNDSALVKITHFWVAPDGFIDYQNQPYRLSNYRYWKIEGILPSQFEATADFFYDGRESSGYLDSLLVNQTEDSLVLLYRETPQSEWAEYPHYTKNVLGSSGNKFGLIEMQKVLMGEYTLANEDHTVLGTSRVAPTQNELQIYPNPNQGQLQITWTDTTFNTLQIFNINGQLVFRGSVTGKNQNSLTHQFEPGSYIVQLSGNNKIISKSIIVQ